jgi:hypothetical protein
VPEVASDLLLLGRQYPPGSYICVEINNTELAVEFNEYGGFSVHSDSRPLLIGNEIARLVNQR